MRPRSEAANQSPTRDATIGPAAAVTPPRKARASSKWPNEGTVALQIIARPQSTIAPPSNRVRGTRCARTPKGTLAAAATSDVTVTRSPISVLLMWRSCLSWIADAPTVAESALASASTDASRRITRARSLPPSAVVTALEPALAGLPAAAAATSVGRRRALSSPVIEAPSCSAIVGPTASSGGLLVRLEHACRLHGDRLRRRRRFRGDEEGCDEQHDHRDGALADDAAWQPADHRRPVESRAHEKVMS